MKKKEIKLSVVFISTLIFLSIYGIKSSFSQENNTIHENLISFEHIANNVADPVKTANWYKDNLGMKIMRQGGEPSFTTFVADPGENMMFEFYHNPDVPLLDAGKFNHLSIHIAFCVDNIYETKEKLLKNGATIAGDISVSSSGDSVLTLRDPWGLPIQFVKRGKPFLKPMGFRFEHIAFNRNDSRAVADWYVNNLGMVVQHESGEPDYGRFVADAGKNLMFELYQKKEVPVIDFDKIDVLSIHIAFTAKDLNKVKVKLVGARAKVAKDIYKSSAGDSILILRDPWGLPLQFIQRAVPIIR